MRRLPIVATLIVLAAVATMIWLGVWQLQRARWKEGLLASYAAAEGKPMLQGLSPEAVRAPEAIAFRTARVPCELADPAIQIGGRNRRGQTGYRTIRRCTLRQGGAIMVDIGWSLPGRPVQPLLPNPNAAAGDRFFPFQGVLIPDEVLADRFAGDVLPLLLVSDAQAPELQPSVPPSIEDIPNNHRAYAVQWFLFAAVAFTVYLLALRRRAR